MQRLCSPPGRRTDLLRKIKVKGMFHWALSEVKVISWESAQHFLRWIPPWSRAMNYHNCVVTQLWVAFPPLWNSGGAQDCLTSGTCWGHDYRAWLNASVTDHNKLFHNLAVMYFGQQNIFQFWQNQLQLLHTRRLIFIQKRITSLLRGTYFQIFISYMTETKQKTFKMSRKQDI